MKTQTPSLIREEDYEKLLLTLEAAKNTDFHYRAFRFLFLADILWSLGLRISEAQKLRVGDLVSEDRKIKKWIFIKNSKGNKTRRLYLSKNLRQRILGYLKTKEKEYHESVGSEAPLFCSRKHNNNGNILSVGSIEREVQFWIKKARIDNPTYIDKAGNIRRSITSHSFRRAWGTRFLKKTKNWKAAQQLLGHSSPQVTLSAYQFIFDEDIEKEVETMERPSEITI